MNKSTPTTPAKKPTSGRNTPTQGATKRPLPVRKPGPENGYTPSYTPEKGDSVPVTNVENSISIPSTLTTESLSDLTNLILSNAAILHPGIPLKLVTAKAANSGSGVSYHALVASPKNVERETSRWQVEVKGGVVNMTKGKEAECRRRAVEVLLEELERKVARELLER